MSVWTEWMISNAGQAFEKRYRRNAAVRYKNEYGVETPDGKAHGLLRAVTEITVGAQRFEIEDILDKPDGVTDRALVREYYPPPKQDSLLKERVFRSYLEAEVFIAERIG